MALDTIWIAIASVLSVYNISKAVDDHGNVITPDVKLKPGTIRQVVLYPCVFVLTLPHPGLTSRIVTLRRSNVESSQGPGLPRHLFNTLDWKLGDGPR
jgi:hypothetical protein